jgi:DNA polymerase-1
MDTHKTGGAHLVQPKQTPLLVLMDGHAMVHRSWHAISIRQRLTVGSTGEDITAVYGFTNNFLKILHDWNPTHCAIVFDLPVPTFRHKLYDLYKAQRPEAPPELRPQFDRVRQIMEAFNVAIFQVEGYEGDDILGALAHQAEARGLETVIVTGDTDTFQLVSPNVRVALQQSKQDQKVYGDAEVRARYGGLSPAQQPDLKALKGDPSDNIPGVPGIGDKTAIKLLLEHGTLEELLENIDEVAPDRVRNLLLEYRDQALLSKQLATIVRDTPVQLDLERLLFWRYDRKSVVDVLKELEFFSVVPRVPEPNGLGVAVQTLGAHQMVGQPDIVDYRLVDTEENLTRFLEELSQASDFSFDTETTNLDPMRADLVGISFSISPGRAWYVPIGHHDGTQVSRDRVLSDLKPLLESEKISKTAHNCNYDMMVLANHDIYVRNVSFDTMVAAQLLGKKAIGLKNLALDVLDIEMTPISALIGSGSKQVTFDKVPVLQAFTYACADADLTGRLRVGFEVALRREGLWDLFSKVEMPLVPVLVKMQRNGITVDTTVLHEMARSLNQQLNHLETDIYNSVGHTFNINSPQQLSGILFNELGLPKTKRTRTGSYSTDAQSLEAMRGLHPMIDGILDYRQFSKLKGTYVEALPELMNRSTGRLHTSYHQVGSATGRISSSDPNLQNIPIRTELGRQVRRAFVARQGNGGQWLLLSADYSQIELRVLAHLSQDPGLLEAFQRDEDIHSTTGSMMFDVALDSVSYDHRRIAKVLNFGVIYGLSPYGIAQQTGFSPEEGARFIETYFSKYPGILGYLDGLRAQVRQVGYVETALGRRRYLPEVSASNFNVRQAAERMAVNMPIQGTAADIMKIAMIQVNLRMEESNLKSKLLLQVHDELVFEVPADEMEALKQIVQDEMLSAMQLSVPLKVDIKMGYTWADLH